MESVALDALPYQRRRRSSWACQPSVMCTLHPIAGRRPLYGSMLSCLPSNISLFHPSAWWSASSYAWSVGDPVEVLLCTGKLTHAPRPSSARQTVNRTGPAFGSLRLLDRIEFLNALKCFQVSRWRLCENVPDRWL